MSDQTNTHGEPHGGDLTGDGAEKSSRDGKQGERKSGDSDGWWEDRSLGQKILLGIGFGILALAGLFLIGLVTMQLWNWLMPEIFALPRVTYWQTWGLLILSCILFKNIGSGGSNGRSDRKRKRHLRRYMRDDQSPHGESPAVNPQAPPTPAGA